MVIEIKKSKSVFIILGIIGLLSVIASILIVAFVEDRQSIPYILMTPAIVFFVVLIYFIVFLIGYIKKPYLYLIKFEDDYIELTKDREVFYKDISYVLTDDNDFIKYFVITSHNKIRFYHKSKEVNKFLIDLLKSKDVTTILANGVGNVVEAAFAGDISNFGDVMIQFALGGVLGGVGYGASKGIASIFAYKNLFGILGNLSDNSKVNKRLAKAGFGNLKIGKHGLATVYEKMYKKLGFETLEKGLSYGYDTIVGFIF